MIRNQRTLLRPRMIGESTSVIISHILNDKVGVGVRQLRVQRSKCNTYYTNAQRVHKENPFTILGIHYGATQTEIKVAFRQRAAQLHPDVNTIDTPKVAQEKFQVLSKAYEALTKTKNGQHPKLDDSEWSWSIWLRNQQIAESRTDVAGVSKVRPIPPVTSNDDGSAQYHQQYALGHPSGSGIVQYRRNEYISATSKTTTTTTSGSQNNMEERQEQPLKISSSVGRGRNKWVEPKPYQPWNYNNTSVNNNNSNK